MTIRFVVFRLLNAEYNILRWQFAYYCNFISISCFTGGRIFGVKLWDVPPCYLCGETEKSHEIMLQPRFEPGSFRLQISTSIVNDVI